MLQPGTQNYVLSSRIFTILAPFFYTLCTVFLQFVCIVFSRMIVTIRVYTFSETLVSQLYELLEYFYTYFVYPVRILNL